MAEDTSTTTTPRKRRRKAPAAAAAAEPSEPVGTEAPEPSALDRLEGRLADLEARLEAERQQHADEKVLLEQQLADALTAAPDGDVEAEAKLMEAHEQKRVALAKIAELQQRLAKAEGIAGASRVGAPFKVSEPVAAEVSAANGARVFILRLPLIRNQSHQRVRRHVFRHPHTGALVRLVQRNRVGWKRVEKNEETYQTTDARLAQSLIERGLELVPEPI